MGEPKAAALTEAAPPTSVAQFEARSPYFKLDDIILPAGTRRHFEVLLSRIRHHTLLYDEWGLARIDPFGRHTAVNFYGLPGTGKTMCAEALAAALHKQIVEVSYAEIESKYVGETPKNIVAAFQYAKEKDAVLFFDEADSILGRRMTQVTQAADQAVNVSRAVMLKQLDQCTGIVVFATNLAKNFDGAFVRRILMHIEVLSPDREGRLQLWQRMLPQAVPGRDLLPWETLADESAGLVGGEIKNAVLLALAEVANRQGATRQITLEDTRRALEDVHRAKRDIGRYDYDAALPSTTPYGEPCHGC
jgi:SpoVK/Ycf46/Vps4 family AAA+-type ATPase